MDLKETDILGTQIGTHWYYRSKAKAMRNMLGELKMKSVLDVGAGSGFFSRTLLAGTSLEEAWCVDISYESESDSKEGTKPLHFRKNITSSKSDLVLMMDVLEHVDDDVALLMDYVDKVPSGTHFLISVPAFQALWSSHDVFLEHKRRYTLKQLEQTILLTGLEVRHSVYYFGLTLPLAAAMRVANRLGSGSGEQPKSQLTRHHPLVNGVLSLICSMELALMHWNRLAGLTVFSLARKP